MKLALIGLLLTSQSIFASGWHQTPTDNEIVCNSALSPINVKLSARSWDNDTEFQIQIIEINYTNTQIMFSIYDEQNIDQLINFSTLQLFHTNKTLIDGFANFHNDEYALRIIAKNNKLQLALRNVIQDSSVQFTLKCELKASK